MFEYSPSLLKWVAYLMMLVLLFPIVMSVTEFINVAVLKNTHGYPWGWQGIWYYSSPQMYALSTALSAIWDTALLMLILESIRRKRSLYSILIFALFLVVFYLFGI